MKTLIASVLCTAGTLGATESARADEDPATSHAWNASAALRSEYVFRGMTRSDEDPAVQAAFGYRYEPYGFDAGVWASSMEMNSGARDEAAFEVDLHGGFSGAFTNGVGWRLGGRYYAFPDQNVDAGAGDFDMFELNGRLSYVLDALYKPEITAGVAWSPDYFGEDDRGVYVDAGLAFALPYRIGLYTRAGYLDVEGGRTNPEGYDYAHYAVGVQRPLGIFTLDLAWHDASDDCDALAGEDRCEAVVLGVSTAW